MIGSGDLVRALQAASPIDGCDAWTFPVVPARGKRLFGGTVRPEALRLVRSRVWGGVVMSRYVPDGEVRPGSFAGAAPGEAQPARRRRMANGTW